MVSIRLNSLAPANYTSPLTLHLNEDKKTDFPRGIYYYRLTQFSIFVDMRKN
jgi:hypothetical protein